MSPEAIKALLEAVQSGSLQVPQAMEKLADLPFKDLGFAKIDHHRSLRCGAPEVVYGEGKTNEQLQAIASELVGRDTNLLVTRVSAEQAAAVAEVIPEVEHDPVARTLFLRRGPQPKPPERTVLVLCAGTTDLPVAREALVTLRAMNNTAELLSDVGVAGIHRLLAHQEALRSAGVLIVVAGMEGALPSVVCGLVDRPVIAVPTSVGYGAALGGLTAMFGMLTACAPGMTVVNVDNGFGAGYAAARINRL